MTTSAPEKVENKKEQKLVPHRERHFFTLQEEMNKLFDEFRHGFGLQKFWMEPVADFNAKVDMKDDGQNIIVTAELPGVEIKDIEIAVNDSALSIKGDKRSEREEKKENYYRMERNYGSFYRLLPLPCAVEREKVDATYKNGILKVTLPKTEGALNNEKKIQVKAG